MGHWRRHRNDPQRHAVVSGSGGTSAGIAALSAVGVQYLQLPRSIKRVIIAADNDDNKDGIGERVAKALRYRLWLQGKIVSIAVPPKPGQDWNDVLVASAGVAP